MRVKRYIVDTMPEAMQKIRDELGSDAVILSTKELKVGGFLGMFQKKRIEVIAASEKKESSLPQSKISRSAASINSFPPVARQTAPQAYRKTSDLLSQTLSQSATAAEDVETHASAEQNRLSSAVAQAVQNEHSRSVALNQESERMYPESISQSIIEESFPEETLQAEGNEKFPSYSSAYGRSVGYEASNMRERFGTRREVEATRTREDRLFIEIEQMKMLMAKLARQQEGLPELPEALNEMKTRLQEQEVLTSLIDLWINKIYEDSDEKEKDSVSAEEWKTKLQGVVLNFLDEKIGEGIQEDIRVVYIVGPTGVGKTTTIAKLAADQIFRARKKVGFITSDTYRISAIEQLRTYASILNVPLEVVQSPGDVERAMQRLEHCDLILMDTAGRNYLNEMYVAELHSLLRPLEKSETYLVLSLTSKSQDMRKITENFSKYGIRKVIFTKLDETQTLGPIFNLLNEFPLQISYVTNGQNVPDDLLPADRELLSDMLLGAERT